MKIAEDIVEKIEEEFKAWEEVQYCRKGLEGATEAWAILHRSCSHCEDAGEV